MLKWLTRYRHRFVGLLLAGCLLTGCYLNPVNGATPLPPPGGPIIEGDAPSIASATPLPEIEPPTATPVPQSPITAMPVADRETTVTTTQVPPDHMNLPVVAGATGPAFAETINPLTGMVVEDVTRLNRRPIVVKVSNAPALVRPQSGISEADHVYEHYTEAGITRFSAVFYHNAPRRVGSIRSARLIDYEIVPMYKGILAFAGASIGVDKRLYGSESVITVLCQNREDRAQCETEAAAHAPAGYIPPSEFAERLYRGVWYGRPYYYRDEAIPVPHNLFVDLPELWQLAARDGYAQRPDLTGMVFHPAPPPDPSGAGNLLEVRYRTTLVHWHYDPQTGLYYRSSDNQRHFDENTNTQITAENVVVVYAGHYPTDIVESGSGANVQWSLHIATWGEGNGILLRDGLHYRGRWFRPERSDLLMFYTESGEHLYFKPGQTWFQVVPLPEQMNPEVEWVKAG